MTRGLGTVVQMSGFFLGRREEVERLKTPEAVTVIYGLPGIGKSELAYHVEGLLLAADPALRATRVSVESHHEGTFSSYLLAHLTGRSGGLLELVEELATAPHLVIIDDAHAAPSTVAELVDALVRRHQSRSHVLVTSRSALPVVTAPIVIKLGPLCPEESRELALHLAKRQGLELANLDELLVRAGGSPLLLRHLIAGRRRHATSDDPIRASIDVLDSETRRSLIRLAAVAGCSHSRLIATRLVTDDGVFDVLAENFLVDAGPERVTVHGLVRDRVMGDADPDLIAGSRRTAATVLWEDYELHHQPLAAVEAICLTASSGDLDQAFVRVRAANRAIAFAGLDHLLLPVLDRLASPGNPDAILLATRIYLRTAQIDKAEALLNTLPESEQGRLLALLAKATISERTCRLDAATAELHRAFGLVLGQRPKTALKMRLALVRALAGDDQAAHELAIETEAAVDSTCDLDLARRSWMLGIIHALHLEWPTCLTVVHEGRQAARRANVPDLDFLLLLLELLATSEGGDIRKVGHLLKEIEELHPSAHLRQRMSELYVGIAELASGQIERAVKRLEHAYQEHTRRHDTLLALLAGHYWGRALVMHGEMARSIEVLQQVVARAKETGVHSLVPPGELFLARGLLTVGRVAEALELITRYLEHANIAIAAEARAQLALVHAFRGQLEQARQVLQPTLALARGQEPAWANLVLDSAYIELLGGDPERARAAALSILEDEGRAARVHSRGRALFILAATDLAAGMFDSAISELGEIDALAAETGMNFLRVRTALLRSATSHAGGSILERVPAEQQLGYVGILRVLGLRSDTMIVTSRAGRVHTDVGFLGQVAHHHDLLVDIGSGRIFGRSGKVVEGRGVAASILVTLAESLEPVCAERMYQVVWGGHDYHPLRHRNTLYIALNRTRKLLEELHETREVIRREGSGWTISPDIDLAIARRDPRVSTVGDHR